MPVPAVYLRVSDPRQGENHSIPAQRRACRQLCAARDWGEPVEFVEEGASAFTDDPDKRPIFRRLLVAAEAGEIDRIVTLDIDRFARSVLAALLSLSRLETVGCTVSFVNDPVDTLTPDGYAMFTIKATFAHLESVKKAARIRLSQDLMRAEGKWLSRPPFGAMIGADGRLCVDPAKAALLRRILAEAATTPDNAIAERLTVEGIPPPGMDRKPGRWGQPYAGVWYASTVNDIVRRGGWLATQGEPWPSLWLVAAERPRRPKATGGRALRFLSGLMRCPCGGVITYGGARGPLDRLTVQCHGTTARGRRAHCPHRKTYADVYEADVLAQFLALEDRSERKRLDSLDPDAARVALEGEYQRLADVYRAGIYDRARFQAELYALDRRKAALPTSQQRFVDVRAGLPRVQQLIVLADPADRNEIVRPYIDHVTIEGRRALIHWRQDFLDAYGPILQ